MHLESTTSCSMTLCTAKLLARSLIWLALTHAVRDLHPFLAYSALNKATGTGATTPSLTMFKDSVEAGQLISAYAYNANESYSTIGRNFALVEVLDTFANDRAKKVAESVGTPAVARDMMSITKALGQDKLQYWGFSYVGMMSAFERAIFDILCTDMEPPLVQRESVGTPSIVRSLADTGHTTRSFAAMFPNNIRRVLLDGVLNSHDYYAGKPSG